MNRVKHTDYIYVPLDIAKFAFDRDQLLDFFERRKTIPQYSFLKEIDEPWYALEARTKDFARAATEIAGSGWDPEFKSIFPQIVSTVESLPFEHVERVYFLEQRKEVKAHRDVSKEEDSLLGPSTFRCPIINDEPDRTFYLTSLENPERIIFPKLPAETQWFGMNNYNARHGSFMPSAGAKKLMLCVWGRVNREAWLQLLERSVSLYSQHCLMA